MDVRLVSEKDKKSWDDYVYNHPDSVAWQCFDWSSLIKNHYSADFFPLAVFQEGKICGVLPLYNIGQSFLSVPYAVAGGMLTDNSHAQKLLLDEAIAMSEKENNHSITFKQYKVKIEQDLRMDDSYYNRELDLTKPIDEIWNNINELNKQEIEDSAKTETILEYPSNDIDTFYEILLRHHHRNGVPCVSKSWIQDLVNFDMYSIAFLWSGSSIVAATLVKTFKKTVSFPFSCNPNKNIIKYMFALYWELIKNFSSEGIEIFHSGRIPQTDKTNLYRLGWGGRKFPYYYQYYPQGTTRTESSNKRGWKRDAFEICWKYLPRNVVRNLGPKITKRFP
jgi:hypothetical protein